MGRQALEPPGEAKPDLWIIMEMAKQLGLDWNYRDASEVFDELRTATGSMTGMTWARLEAEDALTLPLLREGDPGQAVLFGDGFPRPGKRGLFVPASYVRADELPDEEYPFVFSTGRQLEHWHTGSMTRRSSVLNAIEPVAVAGFNPEDLARIDAVAGDKIRIRSRRGEITVTARADSGIPEGTVSMAFCYNEAAANLLTNPALDPVGKIPEFKYCAVRISALSGEESHAA